jgi:predicted lipoprotein with Yx(FWY)xxD motif
MFVNPRQSRGRLRRSAVLLAAALAGFGVAALAGLAVAKTFTLKVSKNAKVTNFNTHATKREGVVVNSRQLVVYTLSGETTHHPKCVKSNSCLMFWFPVTVSSSKKLAKADGIKGKLGVWKRLGIKQVTLGGHPLYTFKNDRKKNTATGEAIATFGGTWHVVKTKVTKASGPVMGTTSTGTTSNPPPYPYSY